MLGSRYYIDPPPPPLTGLFTLSKTLNLALVSYVQRVQSKDITVSEWVRRLWAESWLSADLLHWIPAETLFLAFEVMLCSVFILFYFISKVFSQRVVQGLNLTYWEKQKLECIFSSESSLNNSDMKSGLVTSALNNRCSRHNFLIPPNKNNDPVNLFTLSWPPISV